jgi:hypothetical protein
MAFQHEDSAASIQSSTAYWFGERVTQSDRAEHCGQVHMTCGAALDSSSWNSSLSMVSRQAGQVRDALKPVLDVWVCSGCTTLRV